MYKHNNRQITHDGSSWVACLTEPQLSAFHIHGAAVAAFVQAPGLGCVAQRHLPGDEASPVLSHPTVHTDSQVKSQHGSQLPDSAPECLGGRGKHAGRDWAAGPVVSHIDTLHTTLCMPGVTAPSSMLLCQAQDNETELLSQSVKQR